MAGASLEGRWDTVFKAKRIRCKGQRQEKAWRGVLCGKSRGQRGIVEELLAEKWREKKQSPVGQGNKSEFDPKSKCLLRKNRQR